MSDASYYVNRLRSSRFPLGDFSALRSEVPPEARLRLLQLVQKNAHLRQRLLHEPFPSTPSKLKTLPILKSLSLAEEVGWLASRCFLYRRELAVFCQLREEHDSAVLAGDFAAAGAALNEVEAQFGCSLWLIKRRLHYLQQASGLEAQKQYADTLKASTLPNSFVPFLAHYASVRNEPAITIGRFSRSVKAILRRSDVDERSRAYLRFHLLPHDVGPGTDFAAILTHEFSGSVIDAYDSLGFLLLAMFGTPPHLSSLAAEWLVRLTLEVGDPYLLRAALRAADEPEGPEKPGARLDFLAAILSGNAPRVIQPVMHLLEQNPLDVDLAGIAIRASAMAPQPAPATIAGRLVHGVAQILNGTAFGSDAVSDVAKGCINNFNNPFSLTLLAVLASALSESVDDSSQLSSAIPALLSDTSCPLWITYVDASVRQRYATESASLYPSKIVSEYVALLAGEDADDSGHLGAEERYLATAYGALAAGRATSAHSAAQLLQQSEVAYYRILGARIAPRALLLENRVIDAASSIAHSEFVQPEITRVLPVKETASRMRALPRRETERVLVHPIIQNYSRQWEDKDADAAVLSGYLDVLDSYAVTAPTDLRPYVGALNPSELIHFLEDICVESVLDRSGVFASSTAVAEERLGICRWLLELNPGGAEQYHTEIKEITRRLLIKRRMKEVEQSKIYVDIDSLRRTVLAELRESFARFEALPKERPGRLLAPGEKSDVRLEDVPPQSGASLPVPADEGLDLLGSMVVRVREEFMSSPDHGLDKYLSVRVRHGTLAGHLRSPVEARQLITTIEPGKSYKPNAKWPQHVYPDHPRHQAWLQQRLERFSIQYDALIQMMRDRLQVSNVAQGDALFRFAITARFVDSLQQEIVQESLTLDQVIERVVQHLNLLLDASLQAVQSYLTTVAKPEAVQLLDQLAVDLEQAPASEHGPAAAGELFNAIVSARTDVQVAFDRVVTWFRRATASGVEPFDLTEAVDIGVESVRNINPRFNATFEIQGVAQLRLTGRFLIPMTDMMFIVFENVIRHSAVEGAPKAVVHCEVVDARLKLVITNELGVSVDRQSLGAKLARTKAAIDAGADVHAMRREGGTGLAKLTRIMRHEFGSDSSVEFDVERQQFVVSLGARINYVVEDSDS